MRDDNAAKIIEQLDKCQPCTDDSLYLPVECVGEIIRLALSMRSRIDQLESKREIEKIMDRPKVQFELPRGVHELPDGTMLAKD